VIVAMKIHKKLKKYLINLLFKLPPKLKMSLISSAKNINGTAKFNQACQLNGKGQEMLIQKYLSVIM
jgi:hypothetical protein